MFLVKYILTDGSRARQPSAATYHPDLAERHPTAPVGDGHQFRLRLRLRFSLQIMNDSLLDAQTAEWRPAKQHSWTGWRKSLSLNLPEGILDLLRTIFRNCISDWMVTRFPQLLLIVSPPKLLCVLDPLYMQAVKLEKIRSNSNYMSNSRILLLENKWVQWLYENDLHGGSQPCVELCSALDQTQQRLFSLDADVLLDELLERSWERWSEWSECLTVCLGSFLNV